MPEGPEVTVLAETLDFDLKNKIINNIVINSKSRYKLKKPDGFNQFVNNIPSKLLYIKNKGKLLYWKFDNGYHMINHLGMSGFWSKIPSKNVCLEIQYEYINNFGFKTYATYYFNDQRHFGSVQFVKTEPNLKNILNKLGPDILNDNTLNYKKFLNIMKEHSNKNITKVLMDQSIISGIGNYIKSESLYQARISPLLKIKELDDTRLKTLYQTVRTVILSSYNSQSTKTKKLKDTPRLLGSLGFTFSVYQRTYDLYGNKIVKTKTPDGRTTHWVPSLQT